jgi:protein-disulfide isomerase
VAHVSHRFVCWRRVYSILGACALTVLAAAPAAAPVDVTITPGMVRGPATAPVTIVEFSDYQ